MAEWVNEDVVDEMLANQKTVLVQSADPTNKYEGQMWTNTSSDPPLVKNYDLTNTQWMEYGTRHYKDFSQGFKPEGAPAPHLHGGLMVQHDSGSSSNAFLFYRANDLWWGTRSQ